MKFLGTQRGRKDLDGKRRLVFIPEFLTPDRKKESRAFLQWGGGNCGKKNLRGGPTGYFKGKNNCGRKRTQDRARVEDPYSSCGGEKKRIFFQLIEKRGQEGLLLIKRERLLKKGKEEVSRAREDRGGPSKQPKKKEKRNQIHHTWGLEVPNGPFEEGET